MKVYLNGKFVEKKYAKISAIDRGFLYGEGVFETMRSFYGRLPFAERHYRRLMKSLSALNIDLKLSLKKFLSLNSKLLTLNRLKDAYIRVTVSAGVEEKPTIFILVKKLDKIPKQLYDKGVNLRISEYRKNQYSLLPRYKTLNYLENILEKRNALKKGCFDTIFLDVSGKYITECATANIFIVKNKKIYTSPAVNYPILPGITREVVIEMAKENRIKVIEKKFSLTELFSADEIFITNSRIGILPVKKIENMKFGHKIPGKIAGFLMRKYIELAYKNK